MSTVTARRQKLTNGSRRCIFELCPKSLLSKRVLHKNGRQDDYICCGRPGENQQGCRPAQPRFSTLDEIVAESERLTSAPVRQLGNWPVSQCLGHLSRAMKMSLEGGPGRAPWWMRWTIGKMFKPLILSRGMRPGFTLPPPVAEILVPAPTVSTTEALNELRSYVRRLQTEPQRFPHPVFGAMTCEEVGPLTHSPRRDAFELLRAGVVPQTFNCNLCHVHKMRR